jgi:hypothetical protein
MDSNLPERMIGCIRFPCISKASSCHELVDASRGKSTERNWYHIKNYKDYDTIKNRTSGLILPAVGSFTSVSPLVLFEGFLAREILATCVNRTFKRHYVDGDD